MNNVRNWSLTVAVAGFLFGFDTVVISGANLPIKELWHTTPLFHGVFIMSMAFWGTVLGALLGGYSCDQWGRIKTLLWFGIFFLVSLLPAAQEPSRLPDAASPKKDQPVFFIKFLLSMI